MSTILNDVKKFIGGLSEDNTAFDADILMYVNSEFSTLTRVGCGPESGFTADETTTWEDYSTDPKLINMVKNYITTKVKIQFDNSTMSSYVLTAHKENAQELLWSINNYCDYWKK